ncbi:MAG: FHA domain-containing protein, partial [Leptolyngbyaceae cyanobacterium CAN_BIN12]|nr:FHA domain-containing protein [Leptolyngbyaceae cyanobacterium CAN_BIN12]
AWTLPVLYMHPEFDGELLTPIAAIAPGHTQIGAESSTSVACLRSLQDNRVWQIRGGYMTIGRSPDNDLILREEEAGASREHAMILRRESQETLDDATYFLRDVSRFGTWVSLADKGWQRVHQQEVLLLPGSQIKFGSSQNNPLEFTILSTPEAPPSS